VTLPARWPIAVGLMLVLAATALRISAALRPGLWADEIFSLAMATGHSLEQPAAEADSSRGDYVEPRTARSPEVFRRYATREAPPAGVQRVVRAVMLSDTSPPLFYLLLNAWTRPFGTGDAALRLFSVSWTILSLPLLWLLGRELGGTATAWSACVLFSLSPVASYYAVEGRMYSLLWFLALALGWLTLRLARDDHRRWTATRWVLTGAAGLLTHYFFAFVWIACVAWLWLARDTRGRARVAALSCLTVVAVLPWYLRVPDSLARWRVSGHWLDGNLPWPAALGRPFTLAAGLLSGRSYLGGWHRGGLIVGLMCLLTAVWIAHRGLGRSMFIRPVLLLWGWIAAGCVGPLVFDVLRHTTTSDVPRYVLPALPAAMLLLAVGLSLLPPALHLASLSLVLLAWLPGERATLFAPVPRPWEPYQQLDARLVQWWQPDDLVLVHSIPSGIIGVARYLSHDLSLAAWVAPLGVRRVPDDLELLLAGRRRVALVKIHDLGAPAAPEIWLRGHARLLGRQRFRPSSAEVLYFAPSSGNAFFAGDSHRVADVTGRADRP
jgi:hypothetical protein